MEASNGADLDQLGLLAAEVAGDWGIELDPPFAFSHWSYVAPTRDGAVLKLVPLDDDEADEEADALQLWAGDGAIRLLRHDRGRRALLLERARPGTDLSAVPEDEATAIAVAVGLRLWRPAAGPFRWIGDHVPRWLDRAERRAGPGSELVPLARELLASLDVGRETLVHGDFHHHNLLDAGGRYVAIDPKPMLGEPEFDVFSFLRNPLSYTMRPDVTERRIAAFAAAGLDEPRIRAWSVIRAAYLDADEQETAILRGLVEPGA